MRFLLSIFFILFSIVSFAADHYAITGTTWGAGGTTWSSSSGGAADLGDPASTDAVIFDANSPNVTISGSPVGLSLTTTGYNGTISGSANLSISGNITLSSTTTISMGSNVLSMIATGTFTQNSATVTVNLLRFNGSGQTFDLGSAVSITGGGSGSGQFNPIQGTLNTNNYAISCEQFSISGSSTRTINMGSSVVTITGTGTALNAGTVTNLTFNRGTSQFKFTNTTNTAITLAGGGLTFYDVWFSRGGSTATNTITGTNTFNDLKDDGTAAHTIVFPNVTTTVSSWTISGTSGNLITLSRTGGSGTWTISDASGTNSSSYVSISNSTATGGATWNANDGTSTDGGGNTGWIFTSSTTTPVLGAVGNMALNNIKNQIKYGRH